LRWLSIATADQQWSKRRRILSSFAPAGMVTVVFLDFSPNWTGGDAYAGFSTHLYLYNLIAAFVIGIIMYFTSNNDSLPRWNGILVFMAFVATVAWLDLLGNECVAVLESIGTITGITETSVGHSILGITVLAWVSFNIFIFYSNHSTSFYKPSSKNQLQKVLKIYSIQFYIIYLVHVYIHRQIQSVILLQILL
jgi:hypothetical protein